MEDAGGGEVTCSGAQARGREPKTPAPLLHDVFLGGLRGDRLVAGLEGEALAVGDDPEVQVELGPVGEGVEDALLPDHLRDGCVLVRVPVPQGLLRRDVAFPELGEPETVRLDEGGELPVVGHVGELHLDLGKHAVEGQALEQFALLHLVQEVAGRERRVYGHPAPELDDLGVYHLDAQLAGDGYPMVAVPDEVGVPDLVQAYGRELLGPVHHLVYPLPAVFESPLRGQERPVEVPVTAHAADYLLHRHGSHPEVDLLDGPEGALYLVEGEQLVGTGVLAQESPDPAQECPPACPGEILVGLKIVVHAPPRNLQPTLPGGKPFLQLQDPVPEDVYDLGLAPARDSLHLRPVEVHVPVQPQGGFVAIYEPQ